MASQSRFSAVVFGLILACLLAPVHKAKAQQAETGDSAIETLSKQSQNPLATITIVPVEHNFDFSKGRRRKMQYTADFQPMTSLPLSSAWNLVLRDVTPFTHQPRYSMGIKKQSGLGDTNLQFYFSPNKTIPIGAQGHLTWGLGGIALLPTATSSQLGSHRWGFGPSAVFVLNHEPWVVAGLSVSEPTP